MASTTSAGSSIAICVTLPATQDVAGFAALTFTEIGQIEKIGAIGATYAKAEFQPLKGPKQKSKGSADYGTLAPSLAHDEVDAGQALLRIASDDTSSKLYAFLVTYPNGAKRYFLGRVFGYPEDVEGADTIIMANPTVEINTKVVKVDAAFSVSGVPAAAAVGSNAPFNPVLSGGTAPYSLARFSGTLPPGRAVVGNSVTGTYTTAGTYNYVLRGTDQTGATFDLPVTETVTAAAAAGVLDFSDPAGTGLGLATVL